MANDDKPVIVQSDRSILLETDGPAFEDARDCLAGFAELVKSPEHIHTYRITPLSLWNGAAAGMTAAEILAGLDRFSKYEIPQNIIAEIEDQIGRYGRLKLYKSAEGPLVLESDDPILTMELMNQKSVRPYVTGSPDGKRIFVKPEDRGYLKCALVKIGCPVEDLAGFVQGAPLLLSRRDRTLGGRPCGVRP
jgi:DNA excision repair protein ERCC-3